MNEMRKLMEAMSISETVAPLPDKSFITLESIEMVSELDDNSSYVIVYVPNLNDVRPWDMVVQLATGAQIKKSAANDTSEEDVSNLALWNDPYEGGSNFLLGVFKAN